MVMHISGTFDYTFVVPGGPKSGSRRMQGTLTRPPELDDRRLLGHAPILEAVEYEKQPGERYSRITLKPGDQTHATAGLFSFTVDRDLITMLRQDDVLHISRTGCAGVGVSVLTGGKLIAAAGAVSRVPLGENVDVRHPWDLVRRAEEVFRERDADYDMLDAPVELSVGGVTKILNSGRPTIGSYEIHVRHGFLWGEPGTDESVSIELKRVCPARAALRSAQLIEDEAHDLRT